MILSLDPEVVSVTVEKFEWNGSISFFVLWCMVVLVTHFLSGKIVVFSFFMDWRVISYKESVTSVNRNVYKVR